MFIEVYISYAEEDEELASQIVENLESKGIYVWWDKKIALDVNNKRPEIEKAIVAAQCFLIIWSKHSINSAWLMSEFDTATKGGGIKPKIIRFSVDASDTFSDLGDSELGIFLSAETTNNNLDNLANIIRNTIGIHGPNEHILKPKVGKEEWDIRDLAIETPVPGMDVFLSFRSIGTNGTFLLMRLDTTDGWVDSTIESAQDRHKPFKDTHGNQYIDGNGKEIVKVNNDIFFILDPLRPISIQIGSMKSKRPSAKPGVISGNIPLDQLASLPTQMEWVSLTLAEILSKEEALQYLWDQQTKGKHLGHVELQADKK